jgi:small subunit ribosomal protein S21
VLIVFAGALKTGTKGVFFSMLKVKSRAGESVQQMMRRFKKLCEKEGLIRDMKRNAYYEKPSEKNRRRVRKARRISSSFS